MASQLRTALHAALAHHTLSGKVLDLGGARSSAYARFLGGTFSLTIVNTDPDAEPDVVHDLEAPLPFADGSYNGALLINILEHVYGAERLLGECARVLVPGGQLVLSVPFLFPVHPSPRDFWRFTPEALERMLVAAGFADVRVELLGSGVFSARALLLERLLPFPLRALYRSTLAPLARFCDVLLARAARSLGRQYRREDYALGFLVTAHKRGKAPRE